MAKISEFEFCLVIGHNHVLQCCNSVGSSCDLSRWTFNPVALMVHEVNTAETAFFEVDDVVRVLDDFRKVHELQRGHGGWSDGMKLVSFHSVHAY